MPNNYCGWCGGKIIGKVIYGTDKAGHLYFFGSRKCRAAWEKMKREGRAVCND